MADKKIITDELLKLQTEKVLQVIADLTYDLVPYTDEEISNILEITDEQAMQLTKILNDQVVANNKLWSSSKTDAEIKNALIESNKYADELIGKISSISLEYVTTLPTSDIKSNVIYILQGTPNTLNVFNESTSSFVSVGDLNLDLSGYYTSTQVDNLLADKADDNTVVHADAIVADLTTTSGSTTLSTAGLQTELDKKANDDEFDTHKNDTDIHITSAERTAWNNKQYKVFNYYDITSKNTINTLVDLIKLVPSGETWYIHALSIPNSVSIADFGFPSGMNRWGAIAISKRANNQTQYYIELSTTADYLVTHKWIGCGSGIDYTNGSVTIPAYTTQWQEIAIGFTNKIDVNSNNSQTPSAKAAFDATIGAMPTTEMVENANNSVLQFPLGNWLIYSTAFAKTLDDLPAQDGGRLQVLGNYVSPNTPWTTRYWVRMYRFSSYAKGEWIRYLSSGDTAGVIVNDSGWLKVCTTSVADVSKKKITLDSSIFSSGDVYYEVKNGVCYISILNLIPVKAGTSLLVSDSMPKPNYYVLQTLSLGKADTLPTTPITARIEGGSTNLVVHSKDNTKALYGSFSYPVAES